jgi:5,5'-dehydrodivanillate O-demethylase oxygenase subunit
MLTTAENEMLTPVGPGTPCGELMRRYWHSEEADQLLQQQAQAHP